MKIEPGRNPAAPPTVGPATWQDVRSGFLLAAAIVAIALPVVAKGLSGSTPAADMDANGTLRHLQGVRTLEQAGWRFRDKTGSVIGETAKRESGEPDDVVSSE